MLKIGTKAPDITIETHTGFKGPISQIWEKGPLILFFYPKDETTVCTKQACTLQSGLAEFGTFDAQVLGSSTDGIESHKVFAEKQNLSFPLVADTKAELAKAYDAFRSLLRISKRITYIIDQQGIIRGAVQAELSVGDHMDHIRETLQKHAAS